MIEDIFVGELISWKNVSIAPNSNFEDVHKLLRRYPYFPYNVST